MSIAPKYLLLASCFLIHAPAQITLNSSPTRVIGQTSVQIKSAAPNLVEGREFFNPQSMALDASTSPPALYVSDTGNNRVLGFRSAIAFANGQKADIVVGQIDFGSTLAQGPGRTLSTGLNTPTGIAVDLDGNLYVVDSANNRILRFPQPFAQTGQPLPDIAIGQTSFSAGSANRGAAAPSNSSLALAIPNTSVTPNTTITLISYIAFDPSANLWVADPGNNRVLRFNASVLGSQAASGPAADIVLGQNDFVSNGYNPAVGANQLTSLTAFAAPTGIAFDSKGRLFVTESVSVRQGRIMEFAPPFFSGQAASRLLGVDLNTPAPPPISEFQLGASPGALFAIGNSIGIADTVNSRILVFPPVEQWTANTTFQAATAVAGQSDFTTGLSNKGLPAATAGTLNLPAAAAFFGNELYVADSHNHRVVVMPQNGGTFGPATRVLGQDAMSLNSINLVEGREFSFTNASSGNADAGMAVDLNSDPPHLYIADTYNNRILGFNDLRNIQPGQKADIVIGQPDFQQTLANYPSNKATTNASGLFAPIGLVVDPNGNLFVADAGNSRVLRFPSPFLHYVPGQMEQADLVLGQSSFTATKITDAFPNTMSAPYGLTLSVNPGLLVSDANLNRVLYFKGALSDLRSGMPASMVFGQPDFNSSAAGSGPAQLNGPHHISIDADDRLYVADTNNSRILIWNSAPSALIGAPAAQPLTSGLNTPRGMYVSPATNDIWVGDARAQYAIRYPPYDQLQRNNLAPNAALADGGIPLAVVQDGWGDLFVADAANRIIIYYPGLAPVNAATFLSINGLAPGMIASLYSRGNDKQFGGQATPAPAGKLPLPGTLNGIQVLFNGSPVPLFYADPNQINFQVPMGAPRSGTADLQVTEVATGRILGDSTVVMNAVSPGIFSLSGNGIGTAAAINKDGTINGPTNSAVQDDFITIYGTGQGFVNGAPDDGNAPSGITPTANPPTVVVGQGFLNDSSIQYYGLAPGLVGVWQLNFRIPKEVITLPTNPTYVIVIQDSYASGAPSTGRGVQIYVKARP